MVELPSAPWRKNKVGRIASATDALFPDMSAVIAPENIVLVDEFACFLIECHERWDGGTLCSYPVQESGTHTSQLSRT
ncbi:hypothetical protein AB0L82_38790 [Nocardia sp. NPDC052001]|uniref:hypothetical protein n=1 Tax=Nocardia sp. NPDC052001 TaxID=3154853 RepID=UPI003421CC92